MSTTRLSPETEKKYTVLVHDLTRMRNIWMQYRSLYGTTPERLELLRRTAAVFFAVMGNVLLEATVLGLARLVDKPSTGKYYNMVLSSLLNTNEVRQNTVLMNRMSDSINKLERTLVPDLLELRNKVLAHRDLKIATDPLYVAVFPSREHIERCFLSIESYLNHFSEFFLGQHFRVTMLIRHPSDAEGLISLLKKYEIITESDDDLTSLL